MSSSDLQAGSIFPFNLFTILNIIVLCGSAEGPGSAELAPYSIRGCRGGYLVLSVCFVLSTNY